MNILLILAHPDPNSFNHSIAETAKETLENQGHKVFYHDIYEEKFDPILTAEEIPKDAKVDPVIAKYCDELLNADGIIIVHPNWWGQPPAILKGWIDRVIRPGLAYRFIEGDNGEGVPIGLLKARSAIVFNTSNTPAEREDTVFGDPLERLWKDCIFSLCGITNFYRIMFRVVVTSDDKTRKDWINVVRKQVLSVFPKEK